MSASSFRANLFGGHGAMVCGGTSGTGAAIGSALAALGAEVTVKRLCRGRRHQPFLARTPIGRWGEPDGIAAALFLWCSPAAAFVTGVILPVDGGYLIA
jgi:NAD(P)-dependent dehydrogenase (short-subunit alcohol dehydrogenase family)